MASAQDLATRLGEYYYLLEKNNAKLRTMPRSDVTAVYDALYKEWHFPNIDAEEGNILQYARRYAIRLPAQQKSTMSSLDRLSQPC